MLQKLHAWVKTLPPTAQRLYYAVETAVVAAVGVFAYQLSGYINVHGDLHGFDWAGQWHISYIAIIAAAVKALVDEFKGAQPTQELPAQPEPPPAPPAQGP